MLGSPKTVRFNDEATVPVASDIDDEVDVEIADLRKKMPIGGKFLFGDGKGNWVKMNFVLWKVFANRHKPK